MSKFKNLKLIISISLILFLVFMIKPCYAVGLDLIDDLTNNQTSDENSSDSQNNSDIDNNNNNSNNNIDDDSNSNSSSNTNTFGNSTANTGNTSNTSTYEPPAATVTDSLPESEMGLSNILNILLIVIGVLLILLAIAILIRLSH